MPYSWTVESLSCPPLDNVCYSTWYSSYPSVTAWRVRFWTHLCVMDIGSRTALCWRKNEQLLFPFELVVNSQTFLTTIFFTDSHLFISSAAHKCTNRFSALSVNGWTASDCFMFFNLAGPSRNTSKRLDNLLSCGGWAFRRFCPRPESKFRSDNSMTQYRGLICDF